MRIVLLLAQLLASLVAGPREAAAAATCMSSIGPGIPPPARVPSGLPGFHAAWFGQSGYMTLCPGERASAVLAYHNSGSQGWVQGRMGEAAFLGTWTNEPGQDQPSVLGGDGQLGSPPTAWPRFDRPAAQPAAYVGPGQVAWFSFAVQAPAEAGVYRLGVRPLVEGARWMEDYGVFWQVTVLNTDGSAPPPGPAPARGVTYVAQRGLLASHIHDAHHGIDRIAAYLPGATGRDRTRPIGVDIAPGTGEERYCCLTDGRTITLVTGHAAWAAPSAAAPDTWSAAIERAELAGHEYVHTWQHELGGDRCMLGVRWIAEGMAESLAYRALVAQGVIPAANLDVFTRRQLQLARYTPLSSLETAFPSDAKPYSVSYLAVDRLLAANGAGGLRIFCERVGGGQEWRAAFAATFGESVDAFYARFEDYRAGYVR